MFNPPCSQCLKCPYGRYQSSLSGATACDWCPPGRSTVGKGSSVATQCTVQLHETLSAVSSLGGSFSAMRSILGESIVAFHHNGQSGTQLHAACMLTESRKLWCSGSPFSGFDGPHVRQWGSGVLPLPPVDQFSTCSSHTCAVTNGSVACFGRGDNHRLGPNLGTSVGTLHAPLFLERLPPIVKVATSHRPATCALPLTGNKVWCWGISRDFLGSSSNHVGPRALTVSGAEQLVDLVVGSAHACVLSSHHRVHCWGETTYGAAGGGGRGNPRDVGLSNVTSMCAGSRHSCAVSEGGVFCWGQNWQGEVAPYVRSYNFRTPTPVPGAHEDIVSVDCGVLMTRAVTRNGSALWWGRLPDRTIPNALSTTREVVSAYLPTYVRNVSQSWAATLEPSSATDTLCSLNNNRVLCIPAANSLLGEEGRRHSGMSEVSLRVTAATIPHGCILEDRVDGVYVTDCSSHRGGAVDLRGLGIVDATDGMATLPPGEVQFVDLRDNLIPFLVEEALQSWTVFSALGEFDFVDTHASDLHSLMLDGNPASNHTFCDEIGPPAFMSSITQMAPGRGLACLMPSGLQNVVPLELSFSDTHVFVRGSTHASCWNGSAPVLRIGAQSSICTLLSVGQSPIAGRVEFNATCSVPEWDRSSLHQDVWVYTCNLWQRSQFELKYPNPVMSGVAIDVGSSHMQLPNVEALAILQGSGFGQTGHHFVSVQLQLDGWLDAPELECKHAFVINATTLSCLLPGGIGKGKLRFLSGVEDHDTWLEVDHKVPELEAVGLLDNAFLQVHGETNVTVHFSAMSDPMLLLSAGLQVSLRADPIRGKSGKQVRCTVLVPSGASDFTCVFPGGLVGSRVFARGILSHILTPPQDVSTNISAFAPVTLGVTSAHLQQSGGSTIVIKTDNVLSGDWDVQVWLNHIACIDAVVLSDDSGVACTTLPGFGASLRVSVVMHGVASDVLSPVAVSYALPVVAAVLPQPLISARSSPTFEQSVNVRLVGANLAPSEDLFFASNATLMVAGANCSAPAYIVWRGPTEIECQGLPRVQLQAPQGGGTRFVNISVGGHTVAHKVWVDAEPVVSSALPSIATAGSTLIVTASHLGLVGASFSEQVSAISLGQFFCEYPQRFSVTSVSCTIGVGYGSDLPVVVHLDGGLQSFSEANFTFVPVVTSVSPSLFSRVNASCNSCARSILVNITGTSIAADGDPSQIAVEFVFGESVQPCAILRVVSQPTEFIECSLSLVSIQGSSASVVVSTGSVRSSSFYGLSVIDAPVPAVVSPSILPHEGGFVSLQGENFGAPGEANVEVFFDNVQCLAVVVDTTQSLRCLMPPGAGAMFRVSVRRRTGLQGNLGSESLTPLLRYAMPVLTYVSPPAINRVADNSAILLQLFGGGFGGSSAFTVSVLVEGEDCLVVAVGNTTVTCSVPASSLPAAPAISFSVRRVTQSPDLAVVANFLHLLRVVQLPKLKEIVPSLFSPGFATNVTITGTDLAVAGTPGCTVFLDELPCLNVRIQSPEILTCTVLPSVGIVGMLHFARLGNVTVQRSIVAAFRQPRILSVLPARFMGAMSNSSSRLEITLSGENFGSAAAEVFLVNGMDSIPCTIRRVEEGKFHCTASRALASVPTPLQAQLSVFRAAAGESSTLTVTSTVSIRAAARPTISRISPPTLSILGNTRIEVFGDDLGLTEEDVVSITVGNAPCMSLVMDRLSGVLSCLAPPATAATLSGAGAATVRVQTAFGLEAVRTSAVTFQEPSVQSFSPDTVLQHNRLHSAGRFANFTVSGILLSEVVPSVTLAGQSIPASQVVPNTQDGSLLLVNVDKAALNPSAAGSAGTINMTIPTLAGTYNIRVRNTASLVVMGPPVLAPLGPMRGMPGSIVILEGSNLGAQDGDVARVMLDIFECPAFAQLTASQLQVVVPFPDVQDTSRTGRIPLPILSNLPEPFAFTLYMTSGFVSTSVASFKYEQSPEASKTSPIGACLLRSDPDVDPGFGYVRWSWQADAASRLYGIGGWWIVVSSNPLSADMNAFEALSHPGAVFIEASAAEEVSTNSSLPCFVLTPSLAVEAAWGLGSKLYTSAEQLHREHQAELLQARVAIPAGPVWVAVAAATGTSEQAKGGSTVGNPSVPAGPILPRCRPTQYLATQPLLLPLLGGEPVDRGAVLSATQRVLCRTCPPNAQCNGAPYEAVVPQGGHYRVPPSSAVGGLEEDIPIYLPCPGGILACPRSMPPTPLHSVVARQVLPGMASMGHKACFVYANSTPSPACTAASALSDWMNRHASTGEPFGSPVGNATVLGCATGYTGPLCATCANGWVNTGSRGGTVCTACGTAAAQVSALVGIGIVGTAMLSGLIWSTLNAAAHKSQVNLTVLKLLLGHAQFLSIASSFPFVWPSELSRLFVSADFLMSAGSEAISTDCLLPPQDFSDGTTSRFLLSRAYMLLIPVVIALGLVVTFLLVIPLVRFMRKTGLSANVSEQSEDLRTTTNPLREGSQLSAARFRSTRNGCRGFLERATLKAVQHKHTSQLVVALLTSGFMLHLSMTRASLDMMTCATIAGRSVLAGDISVSCDDPAVQRLQFGVGIPGFIGYAIGIPAFGAALLAGARSVLVNKKHPAHVAARRTLGFAYTDYRSDIPIWESVVQGQKVLLAFVSVVLQPAGIASQATTGAIVALAALTLQLSTRPYHTKLLNSLASASLWLVVLTLLLGLLLVANQSSVSLADRAGSRVSVAVTAVMWSTNLFFVGTCMVLLVQFWISENAEKVAVAKSVMTTRLKAVRSASFSRSHSFGFAAWRRSESSQSLEQTQIRQSSAINGQVSGKLSSSCPGRDGETREAPRAWKSMVNSAKRSSMRITSAPQRSDILIGTRSRMARKSIVDSSEGLPQHPCERMPPVNHSRKQKGSTTRSARAQSMRKEGLEGKE